jgi:uncharacterized membrane protein YdbT with pleckstrin-like domain
VAESEEDDGQVPEEDDGQAKRLRRNYLIISVGVLIVVIALLVALIVKASMLVTIIAVLIGAAVAFALYRFTMQQAEQG